MNRKSSVMHFYSTAPAHARNAEDVDVQCVNAVVERSRVLAVG